MPLTANQRQQVLRECGEDLHTSPFLTIMTALESAHAGEEAVDPRLLPLRVRQDILRAKLGPAAEEVDHKEGDEEERSSQAFSALHKRYQDTKAEIAELIAGTGPSIVASQLCEPEAVSKLSQS